jgi:hypothetical protein
MASLRDYPDIKVNRGVLVQDYTVPGNLIFSGNSLQAPALMLPSGITVGGVKIHGSLTATGTGAASLLSNRTRTVIVGTRNKPRVECYLADEVLVAVDALTRGLRTGMVTDPTPVSATAFLPSFEFSGPFTLKPGSQVIFEIDATTFFATTNTAFTGTLFVTLLANASDRRPPVALSRFFDPTATAHRVMFPLDEGIAALYFRGSNITRVVVPGRTLATASELAGANAAWASYKQIALDATQYLITGVNARGPITGQVDMSATGTLLGYALHIPVV